MLFCCIQPLEVENFKKTPLFFFFVCSPHKSVTRSAPSGAWGLVTGTGSAGAVFLSSGLRGATCCDASRASKSALQLRSGAHSPW